MVEDVGLQLGLGHLLVAVGAGVGLFGDRRHLGLANVRKERPGSTDKVAQLAGTDGALATLLPGSEVVAADAVEALVVRSGLALRSKAVATRRAVFDGLGSRSRGGGDGSRGGGDGSRGGGRDEALSDVCDDLVDPRPHALGWPLVLDGSEGVLGWWWSRLGCGRSGGRWKGRLG